MIDLSYYTMILKNLALFAGVFLLVMLVFKILLSYALTPVLGRVGAGLVSTLTVFVAIAGFFAFASGFVGDVATHATASAKSSIAELGSRVGFDLSGLGGLEDLNELDISEIDDTTLINEIGDFGNIQGTENIGFGGFSLSDYNITDPSSMERLVNDFVNEYLSILGI